MPMRALRHAEAITKDGGFAVLAHPGQQHNLAIVPDLIEAGLFGIESICIPVTTRNTT